MDSPIFPQSFCNLVVGMSYMKTERKQMIMNQAVTVGMSKVKTKRKQMIMK